MPIDPDSLPRVYKLVLYRASQAAQARPCPREIDGRVCGQPVRFVLLYPDRQYYRCRACAEEDVRQGAIWGLGAKPADAT